MALSDQQSVSQSVSDPTIHHPSIHPSDCTVPSIHPSDCLSIDPSIRGPTIHTTICIAICFVFSNYFAFDLLFICFAAVFAVLFIAICRFAVLPFRFIAICRIAAVLPFYCWIAVLIAVLLFAFAFIDCRFVFYCHLPFCRIYLPFAVFDFWIYLDRAVPPRCPAGAPAGCAAGWLPLRLSCWRCCQLLLLLPPGCSCCRAGRPEPLPTP